MPSCRSTVDRYQSIVLSSPSSSRIEGWSVCDSPRTLSSAACGDFADLAQVAAQRRSLPAPGVPARPSIEPMAVRSWPNSSCSSREISRSVDSRAAISFCASSRRSSESVRELGEQPPVRSNQVQAGQRNGGERGGEEPVDLPLHDGVDVLDLLRRLLLGRIVLDQQPRHRGASASCRACSDSRIWRRASSSWPDRASSKMRSAASQNCATELARYCACSGRPPGDSHALLLRRGRRPDRARMRANCADQAVSG